MLFRSRRGHGAPVEEIRHGAGERRIDDGVDLAALVQTALGEPTDTRAFAWRETVADRDLSRHGVIVDESGRVRPERGLCVSSRTGVPQFKRDLRLDVSRHPSTYLASVRRLFGTLSAPVGSALSIPPCLLG